MSYIVFFARATLLVVFSGALVGKLHSRSAWQAFVAATATLLHARRWGAAWATGAVILEGVTVGCLSINATAYAGLILALVGLLIFLLVTLSGVTRGVQTSCNCFGSDGTTLSWAHVWRNILLVCIAASGTGAAMHSTVPPVYGSAAYATPIVLSLVTAAVFVMWDDVTYLLVGPLDSKTVHY